MADSVAHGTAILWFGQAAIVLVTQTLLMLQPEWFDWYRSLKRPWFAPANWVFGVAWLILYALYATSGYLAFKAIGTNSTSLYWGGLVLYELLLIMLAVWPFVFFHLRIIQFALLVLGATFLTSVGCVVIAFYLNTVAGALLVVMPVWLLYAVAINIYIAVANDVDNIGGGTASVPLTEFKSTEETKVVA